MSEDVGSGAGQPPSPGPVPNWCAALVPLDVAALSDAARIDALVALERVRGWVDAQQLQLLAVMAPPGDPGGPSKAAAATQSARDEIACALRQTPGRVNERLHHAAELTTRLPDTLALLAAGEVSMQHGVTLVDALTGLSDEVATRVQARVLPRAAGQTVAAFRRCVTRAVISEDPRTVETRHEAAVAERKVWVRNLENAMGLFTAMLPIGDIATIMTSINAHAANIPATDERTADQRRADTLVAIATHALTGAPIAGHGHASTADGAADADADADADAGAGSAGDPSGGCGCGSGLPSWQGRRPSVQVSVALSTLLGLDEQAAELEGYGPIPAAVARRIAADPSGTWRRLVTDPLSGALLDYGRTTYRPPQDLADWVITRDQTCRYPGCHHPARRCELDHRDRWTDGGHTKPGNVQALSTRHHHLKDEGGWRTSAEPDGTITWTSPTGHTYTDPPLGYPIDHTVDHSAERPSDDARPDPDPPPF